MTLIDQSCFVGRAEQIMFINGDFKIMRFSAVDYNSLPDEVWDASNVRVKAYNLPFIFGMTYKIYGSWQNSRSYGWQFCSSGTYILENPQSRDTLIGYLSSSLFKKIGVRTAEKIVDTLGLGAIDLIMQDRTCLDKVKGLSRAKKDAIVDALIASAELSKLVTALAKYGIKTKDIMQIRLFYPDSRTALEAIKSNPYSLLRFGIAFKVCDQIAAGLGIPADSDARLVSSLGLAARQLCSTTGNTYTSTDAVKSAAVQILDSSRPHAVCADKLDKAMRLQSDLRKDQIVIRSADGVPVVFPRRLDDAEMSTALKLQVLLEQTVSTRTKKAVADTIAKYARRSADITISDEQADAIENALTHPVSIITGGPGTGKTTIVKGIISVYKAMHPFAAYGERITCMAPTGKAARRLSESTGMPASTIHHALGITPETKYQTNGSFASLSGLIIVDEVSMVSMMLMSQLVDAVNSDDSILVLVGDENQLPSVGPGAVMHALIETHPDIYVSRLTKIYRQADGSTIPINAEKIKDQDSSLVWGDDFRFITETDPQKIAEKVCSVYKEEIAKTGIQETAVLCPRRIEKSGNREHVCASDALTVKLRDAVNPITDRAYIMVNHVKLHTGDRVMQTKNSETSVNGDCGTIESLIRDAGNNVIGCRIRWDYMSAGDAPDAVDAEDMDTIVLAYAMSIHKSQGSQYKTVIIPLPEERHCPLYKRRLFYTAVTRASEKVILIGSASMISVCVSGLEEERKTLLAERLERRLHGSRS